MSLPADSLDPIPEETARVAHAAFPKGSLAITLHDVLGTVYHDGMFADLYPPEGQPALAPWRLALVTVLQYAENLTDRQAATAVRGRIDWKYALALPLTHPGFDASDLSTFRDRVLAGRAEERLLWAILEVCQERGLLQKRGRQRTDSTHVLAAIRALSRLELVGETLRAALEALAVAAPDWLREQAGPAWAKRYSRRIEEYRLPEGRDARRAWAEETGADGLAVLTALAAPRTPRWLRELPAVQVLQQMWEQQYTQEPAGMHWRTEQDLPPGSGRIESPYDPEARYGEKRQTRWVGGKAHVTEQHDPDQPALIVQIATTDAAVPDVRMMEPIWEDLATRDLVPRVHTADPGYVDTTRLVDATTRGIDLVGPVQQDSSWQARAGQGYAASDFTIDWEQEQARCPAGKTSRIWAITGDGHGGEVIRIRFAHADCAACPVKTQCTRSTEARTLTLLPTKELHAARRAAQTRQQTAVFRERYHHRAGIEGTISQAVRTTGLRQARYRGQDKLHLQHCAEAAAINVIRLVEWFDDTPRATTRRSHLTRLLAPAA